MKWHIFYLKNSAFCDEASFRDTSNRVRASIVASNIQVGQARVFSSLFLDANDTLRFFQWRAVFSTGPLLVLLLILD